MTAQKIEDSDVVADRAESVNEVRLVGRLSGELTTRQVAAGVVVQLKLKVERPAGDTRQRADTVECAVWSAALQKRVAKWNDGDLVELTGAVHQRFWREGGATVGRTEVEMSGGRLIRRAGSG